MSSSEKALKTLIVKFTDYFIQESGYYVTEKANIKTTDNRKTGYRKQTSSVGENRVKAINWMFQVIQVSREEMVEYVDRYLMSLKEVALESNDESYAKAIMQYTDSLVEDYFIFQRPDTRQRVDIFQSYRTVSVNNKSAKPSKYEMRFETIQPSREDMIRHVEFFLTSFK